LLVPNLLVGGHRPGIVVLVNPIDVIAGVPRGPGKGNHLLQRDFHHFLFHRFAFVVAPQLLIGRGILGIVSLDQGNERGHILIHLLAGCLRQTVKIAEVNLTLEVLQFRFGITRVVHLPVGARAGLSAAKIAPGLLGFIALVGDDVQARGAKFMSTQSLMAKQRRKASQVSGLIRGTGVLLHHRPHRIERRGRGVLCRRLSGGAGSRGRAHRPRHQPHGERGKGAPEYENFGFATTAHHSLAHDRVLSFGLPGRMFSCVEFPTPRGTDDLFE